MNGNGIATTLTKAARLGREAGIGWIVALSLFTGLWMSVESVSAQTFSAVSQLDFLRENTTSPRWEVVRVPGNTGFYNLGGYVEAKNGDPVYSVGPNVYRMTNNLVSSGVDTLFPVSNLTYFNAQTWQGSTYSDIPVSLTANFGPMGNGPDPVTFNFDFDLNITPNGSAGVPDELRFVSGSSSQEFTFNNQRYTLELAGFVEEGLPAIEDNIVDTFVLPEDQTVEASLMARFTEVGNDTVITAGPDLDFGRVMRRTEHTDEITINKTGSDGTSYNAIAENDGLRIDPEFGTFLGGSESRIVDVTLASTDDGTDTTGAKDLTVTVVNTAQSSDGPGLGSDDPDDVIQVAATVVKDRQITADPVSIGRVMVGQTTNTGTVLRTTGEDEHNTRVTVETGAYGHGDAVATVGTARTFNEATDALGVLLDVEASQQGVTADEVTLSDGAGLTGEGLVGEVVQNVDIQFSYTGLKDRELEATDVNLGRFVAPPSGELSGQTEISTTGEDSQFTRVELLQGQYQNADAATVAIASDRLFDEDGETVTAAVTLTGVDGSSDLSGAITLSESNGALLGEGLVAARQHVGGVIKTAGREF